MKLIMFSVSDLKAKVFSTPVFSRSTAENIRAFTAAVNNPEMGNWNKYPEDFVLYRIGEFDDETCVFVPEERPVPICVASEVLAKPPVIPAPVSDASHD